MTGWLVGWFVAVMVLEMGAQILHIMSLNGRVPDIKPELHMLRAGSSSLGPNDNLWLSAPICHPYIIIVVGVIIIIMDATDAHYGRIRLLSVFEEDVLVLTKGNIIRVSYSPVAGG